MLTALLPYPAIDPVLVQLGPFAIRWYALSYIAGLLFGWWAAARMTHEQRLWKNPTFAGKPPITADQIGDLVVWATFGVILGGRIGWILFYGTALCLASPHTAMCQMADGPNLPLGFLYHPLKLIEVWEGGMSFHGGLAGALIAEALLARKKGKRIADMFDFLAPLPGIGIFAVRVANFINGELWGKPTDVPWAFVVDPTKVHERQSAEAKLMCERFHIDPCVLHVHASQLYEGLLEGLLVFVILWYFTSRPRPRLAPSGLFLLCYGIARFAVEFVRVPDWNRGYLLFDWVTMGQILSTPMILGGIVLLAIAYRRNEPSGNLTTVSA